MATNPIDFSSIGGKPAGTIDFSAIGGKPVAGTPTTTQTQTLDPNQPAMQAKPSAFYSDLKNIVTGAPEGIARMLPGPQQYYQYKDAMADVESVKQTGKTIQQRKEDARKAAGYGTVYRKVLAPLAESVGVNVGGMEQAASEGDAPAVLGHAAAAATPAIAGAIGGELVGGLKGVPAPPEAITQPMVDNFAAALKPSAKLDAVATAKQVLPEIRKAAADIGITPSELEGRQGHQNFIKVVEQANRNVSNKVDTLQKPILQQPFDTTSAADAVRQNIGKQNSPATNRALALEAKRIQDGAATYGEADKLVQTLNKELAAHYDKTPEAASQSPIVTQALEDAADELRARRNEMLSNLTNTPIEDVRNLKATQGALIDAKDALRKNVVATSNANALQAAPSLGENIRNSGKGVLGKPKGYVTAAINEVVSDNPVKSLSNRMKGSLKGVQPPPANISPVRYPTAAAIMAAAKSGDITPQEADKQLQRLQGGTGTLRRIPKD